MRMQRRGRLWVPEAPEILIRRHREITGVRHRIGVRGRWLELALVHARTGEVTQRLGPFDNHIVDAGLNMLASVALSNDTTGSVFSYCGVGTGSTPPSDGDTTPQAEVARTNSTGGFAFVSGLVDGNTRWRAIKTWVFGTNEANDNLAEIVVGRFPSSTWSLLSRQLILDQFGNPTTLPKTSEYQLRCVYEFSTYLMPEEDEYEVDVNGSPVEVLQRIGPLSSWDTTRAVGNPVQSGDTIWLYPTEIGTPGSNPPSITGRQQGAITAAPYTPGSFKQEFETIWGTSAANDGPYPVIAYTGVSGRSWKVDISGGGSGVSKTSDERFVLLWERSWGRHTP